MNKVEINGVEINGETYVREADLTQDSDIKIVILQRGWIKIGYFHREGNDCTLTKAYTIRRWGTTKGLGELTKGKTSKTVLDYDGTVHFDYLTVVATIDCEVKAWEDVL